MRSPAVAANLETTWLARAVGPEPMYEGPLDFRLTTGWQGLGVTTGVPIDLGSVIAITHTEGYGQQGYVDRARRGAQDHRRSAAGARHARGPPADGDDTSDRGLTTPMPTNFRFVVDRINAAFPWLLQWNAHSSNGEFLQRVAAEPECRAERVGLLSKSAGEAGYTFPNGQRTSHDVLAWPNGERVDIIQSAGGHPQPGGPAWGVIPPDQWRPVQCVGRRLALADL